MYRDQSIAAQSANRLDRPISNKVAPIRGTSLIENPIIWSGSLTIRHVMSIKRLAKQPQITGE
jgi:hypothetical protein